MATPYRLLTIKALSLFFLGMSVYTQFYWTTFSENQTEILPAEVISVRESTTELQVAVGDKIFVFGKAKGTLDKVKVGMHVLLFSQAADQKGDPNTFSTVKWKKLKDGAIQIQSSYNPWPKTLTWTVFANGKLKMDASAPPDDIVNSKWLGLGFNFPDQMLNQLSWHSVGIEVGSWKNLNFVPMADPEIEIPKEGWGVFQPIKSVRMEFETVILDVSTKTSGVFFGLGENENLDSTIPKLNADMIFLFNKPIQNPEIVVQPLSKISSSGQILSQDPLVL
jgi:hypothetical protein